MAKITNGELIRHLDTSKTKTPLFIENVRTLSDEGFRSYLSDIEKDDIKRRSDFLKENPSVFIPTELKFL